MGFFGGVVAAAPPAAPPAAASPFSLVSAPFSFPFPSLNSPPPVAAPAAGASDQREGPSPVAGGAALPDVCEVRGMRGAGQTRLVRRLPRSTRQVWTYGLVSRKSRRTEGWSLNSRAFRACVIPCCANRADAQEGRQKHGLGSAKTGAGTG